MTLAEFLLARIAEDHERADFVRRQVEDNNWTPSDPWALSWHDEYDLLCIEPSRALAECEAKRRIVELTGPRHYVNHDDCWYSCPAATLGDDTDNEDALNEQGECTCGYDGTTVALRALAAVYADHPDYDETWRP